MKKAGIQKRKDAYARMFDQYGELMKKHVGKQQEHYDFTPVRYKKRRDATLRGILRAKEQLKDTGSQKQIERGFAYSNILIMRGGYNDTIDWMNATTLAAAIWILDQLTLRGKTEQIYPYLPNEPRPEMIALPVNHPMYDEQLIYAVVQLIRQRNTSKALPNPEWGALQWDNGAPDQDSASKENRDAYEQVIGLLDPEAIRDAVTRYENDVWAFYRLSFTAMHMVEDRISALSEELSGSKSQTLSNVLAPKQASPLLVKQETVSPSNILDFLSVPPSRMEALSRQIEALKDITFTDISLVNDREKTTRRLKNVIPEELANEIIRFRVEDPFESAFALLYLLDTDSDIPWYYYGSLSVAYTMVDQFPYVTGEWNANNPLVLSGLNIVLYEHNYSGYRWQDMTDASDEPVQRGLATNLSQLLFSYTGSLFPRVVPDISSLSTFLERFEDLTAREKELCALLLHSLSAGGLRATSLDEYRLLQEINQEDAPGDEQAAEETAEDTPDSLELIQKENNQLRQKNARLMSIIRENQKLKKAQKKQIEQFTLTVKQQQKELNDLREKVFLSDQTQADEPEDKTIQYPYYSSIKNLSFGGQAAWINEMKAKLPNMVFISAETMPNTDLIRGADTIWIQTNSISHKHYYKIMSALKGLEKQIRYFVFPGVNKCAEQVVRYCEQRGYED